MGKPAALGLSFLYFSFIFIVHFCLLGLALTQLQCPLVRGHYTNAVSGSVLQRPDKERDRRAVHRFSFFPETDFERSLLCTCIFFVRHWKHGHIWSLGTRKLWKKTIETRREQWKQGQWKLQNIRNQPTSKVWNTENKELRGHWKLWYTED